MNPRSPSTDHPTPNEGLYPPVEPHAQGHLDVGGGHEIYWEVSGNPAGKPAMFLHGGPGMPVRNWARRLFDPARYCIIVTHQRNCGQSRPHASEPTVDLTENTTRHLLEDLERIRRHLAIDRWMVVGASWGSTLALAHAQEHPERVTELVLFGVFTGAHAEFDRVLRGGLARQYPDQWRRLKEAVLGDAGSDADVVDAAHRLLFDPDTAVQARVAYEWCVWESAIQEYPPSPEVSPLCDKAEQILAFARIVTHYTRHYAWLEDGALLAGAGVLGNVPAVLIAGRHDPQTPPSNAEDLAAHMPQARVRVVEDAGHGSSSSAYLAEIVRATDAFAQDQQRDR
jgi:proline iminopeptidase